MDIIKPYEPDVIIFGYTFPYFRDDLQISDEPIHTELNENTSKGIEDNENNPIC